MFKITLLSKNIIYKSKFINPLSISRFCIALKNTTVRSIKDEGDDDTPIKYMQSPASKWHAKSSRTGFTDARLWYEPHIILGSLIIFMTYFCILREENQIDKELERTLYSRISGLEEQQLIASLEHNKSLGLNTSDIEVRLKQIQSK